MISQTCFALPAFVHSWIFNVGIIGVANVALPAGAVAATVLVFKGE
ncbi:MAG TPA: hypothetical protein VMF61_07155 [Candidatus Acidoferrales bacterium]|nr:hypothetical protein [Candidatus Acidoferrales bacterium]